MAFARRSRIVPRPNLALKGKKSDACDQPDIFEEALTVGAGKPDNVSVPPRDSSLLPDSGCVSLETETCPSKMTGQTANSTGVCESGRASELSAADASINITGDLILPTALALSPGAVSKVGSSEGISSLIEKADFVSRTAIIHDRASGHANSVRDPGVTSRECSDEGLMIQSSSQVEIAGQIGTCFPESSAIISSSGRQPNSCNMTRQPPEADSVRDVGITADRHAGKCWPQAASEKSCQSISEEVAAVVVGSSVSTGTHVASKDAVATAAAGGGNLSHMELQENTIAVDGDVATNSVPPGSCDVGRDTCMLSQDNIEQQSPAIATRPRPRLKVRPNVAGESARAKQVRHGGVTNQHSVTWQKKDAVHEPAAESTSADKYCASTSNAELAASAGSDTLRFAADSGPSHQAGGVLTGRKEACDSTVEVVAVSSVSSTMPPPAKKPKTRRKVTSSAEPVDRSKMTMKELLYWNPTSNPMARPPAQPLRSTEQSVASKSTEVLAKQSEAASPGGAGGGDTDGDSFAADPVPQVMVGEDGQIILNESSLLIHSAPVEHVEATDIAVEDHRNYVTSNSFRKRLCTKFWSLTDTCQFFKALSYVGTDFSMMNKLFPKRSRAELKNKFKREEKLNKKRVDLALQGELRFDAEAFTDSESSSKEPGDKSRDKAKGKAKGSSTKRSKSSVHKSKRRKMSEEESDHHSSVDDTSTTESSRLDAEDVMSVLSQEEPEPVGKRTRAASAGSSRSGRASPALPSAGDGLQAKSEQKDKQMTVLPVTDPLSNVEAGQLIFVVPDTNAEDIHGGSNEIVPPGQQVIHVYVVSPPD